MEFVKLVWPSACFFAICLMISASNSLASPVQEAQDHGLEYSRFQKCPYARGQFPHFKYCDWFYNCWDGAVFEQQCPKGLAFNPMRQYCDYPANVNCGGRVFYADTQVNSMCPAPDGIFPDPWECSYFVQCAGGRGTRMTCPQGLLFNPKFYGCDYPQNVQCQGSWTPSTPGTVIPPTPETHKPDGGDWCHDGYYPHTNCRGYWMCTDHRLVFMYCPAGQEFDISCGKCRDKQLVQCHVNVGTNYGRSADQDAVTGASE